MWSSFKTGEHWLNLDQHICNFHHLRLATQSWSFIHLSIFSSSFSFNYFEKSKPQNSAGFHRDSDWGTKERHIGKNQVKQVRPWATNSRNLNKPVPARGVLLIFASPRVISKAYNLCMWWLPLFEFMGSSKNLFRCVLFRNVQCTRNRHRFSEMSSPSMKKVMRAKIKCTLWSFGMVALVLMHRPDSEQ